MRLSLAHILALKLGGTLLGLFLSLPWSWICVLFFVPDLWVLYHVFNPRASGIVRTVTRFQTGRPEIWLTIDDGPDEHDTPRILDLLDRHDARATFFLIGERAARHPGLVAEIARRGHEIGHHTHSHRCGTFCFATPARLRTELDAAFPPLSPEGTTPRRFRPPVGIKNLFLARALAARGLRCIAWNVRSLDTLSRDPEKVASRVLRRIHPGSIVLMHEGPPLHPRVRVAALELVMDGLGKRGLRCVIPSDDQLR
jgi:peptidoglycan/xylan/chitin deacetylase (PgdA/CDA1 family)